MANEKFKVKFGLAVGDTAATIDATSGEGIFSQGTNGQVIVSAGVGDNGRIEIGNTTRTVAGTPYVDFHSSANSNDYDVRMLASGGTSNDGEGTLTITATTVDINGNLTTNGVTGGNVTVGVVDDQTISTTSGDLNIYPASAGRMYLETADVDPIFAVRNTSNTNIGTRALTLRADSTGTPAVGFGTLLEFQTETAANVFPRAGYIGVNSTDITSGAENFEMNFGLMKNGATYGSVMTLDSSGNLQIDGDLTVTGGNISTNILNNRIQIDRTTDTTNVARNALILQTETTGTPVVGMGTAMAFNSQIPDGTFKEAGFINVISTDVTPGSEDFSMNFGLITAGSTYTTKLTVNSLGNLITTGNFVKGNIRNATTEANGDIWTFSAGAGSAYRGISLDNSINTTKRPGMTIRSYGISGGAPRTGIIMEGARGTAASPSNLNSGDVIGDIFANGYTSTGWASDQVNIVPGIARFYTTEAWNDGLNKVGTGFRILLQPSSTALTTSSPVTAFETTPAATIVQKQFSVVENRATSSSNFALTNFTTARFSGSNYSPTQSGDPIGQFKFNGNAFTGTSSGVPFGPGASIYAQATETWNGFNSTGSSISGTTLTIGTLTAGGTIVVGQTIYGTGVTAGTTITANISGSGSGSTWTVSNSQSVSSTAIYGGENGTQFIFNAIKNNTLDGYNVITGSPDLIELNATTLDLNSYDGTTALVGNNINYNRVYGQWQNLNTVTPAGSNTAYAFALPTQDFANIATVGSTSRIIPGAAGMYKLQFSVQVQNDDTADEHVAYFWWRKNGTDVPGSMGRVGIFKAKGAVNGLTIAGWDNMISSANTTDYWELMYAVDDAAHVDFPTFASTAFGPATSSLFVTLVPIGA